MCYSVNISKTAAQIEAYYRKTHAGKFPFFPMDMISGFTQPFLPIISSKEQDKLITAQWGFNVDWIKTPILNAKSEELKDKITFSNITENRCLLPIDGFYEWKWLDHKGKKKQKHLLKHPDQNLFSLAGIYREFTNETLQETYSQFVVLTTQAIGIMEEVHNSKKRMPIAFFDKNKGEEFLNGGSQEGDYEFLALPDEIPGGQMDLF